MELLNKLSMLASKIRQQRDAIQTEEARCMTITKQCTDRIVTIMPDGQFTLANAN